jgi:hypothetical protein
MRLSSTYRMPASEGSGEEAAAPVRESKSPASVQSVPAIARLAESYEEVRADEQLLKRQVLRISEQFDNEEQQTELGAAPESSATEGRGRRSRPAMAAAAIFLVAAVAAGGSRLWGYLNSREHRRRAD